MDVGAGGATVFFSPSDTVTFSVWGLMPSRESVTLWGPAVTWKLFSPTRIPLNFESIRTLAPAQAGALTTIEPTGNRYAIGGEPSAPTANGF